MFSINFIWNKKKYWLFYEYQIIFFLNSNHRKLLIEAMVYFSLCMDILQCIFDFFRIHSNNFRMIRAPSWGTVAHRSSWHFDNMLTIAPLFSYSKTFGIETKFQVTLVSHYFLIIYHPLIACHCIQFISIDIYDMTYLSMLEYSFPWNYIISLSICILFNHFE